MPLTNVHHSALCLLRDQTTLIYNTLGKQHFQIKVISMHFFYSPANFLFGLQSSTSTILKFCSTAFLSFFLLLSFKETRKPILPLFMMYSNCPTVLQMASYIKFVQVQVNCQMERKISRNENPISKEPRNCRESTSHSGLMENNLYFLILWCEKIPRWE